MFRLLPAFLLGILAGVFSIYLEPFWILLLCIAPVFILIGQVLLSKKFFSYRHRWMFGLSAHLLTFSFAYLLTELKMEIKSPVHFSKFENVSAYLACLDDSKQEKSKSYKVTIRIVSVKSRDHWMKAGGRCLVYISKDSVSEKLRYGDLIVFTKIPAEVRPPANPSQFNYKRWLSFNQVYHQLFLASSTWSVIAHHHGNSIVEMAIDMREKLLKIFRDNNISGDDYAVVSALLLGDTGEIDQEIINAYAASGALHVLSVSGLHVGIIYLAFSAMLFFMDRNRKTKILKAGILILFLWFYALLTGLSPAVLRSAAMLSYIVIGKALDRTTNMYNTLAASAMTLLCFQPHLLMQVGFQLSYLAVLGIVFLYRRIHLLLDPKTWLLKQIWSLTAVSIAAQVATFPLGLFYFHQFPNYFLFSNLLVIPVSTVIIYGGIVLFIISPFTMLSTWIGLALGKTVHFLNWTVITVEHLPYSLLQGISLTVLETYLVYITIFMLILYFLKKEVSYLFVTGTGIVLLLSLQIAETTESHRQKQFVVYDVPKTTAINLIDGNSGVLIGDSTLVNNKSLIPFNILHYWWDCGLNEDHVTTVISTNEFLKKKDILLDKNMLKFHDKKILILNDVKLCNHSISTSPDIDYIVLAKNLKIHIDELVKKFRFKQLIIDSSNSNYYTERWIKEAEELGIACYSVQRSGAYVLKFQ